MWLYQISNYVISFEILLNKVKHHTGRSKEKDSFFPTDEKNRRKNQ